MTSDTEQSALLRVTKDLMLLEAGPHTAQHRARLARVVMAWEDYCGASLAADREFEEGIKAVAMVIGKMSKDDWRRCHDLVADGGLRKL